MRKYTKFICVLTAIVLSTAGCGENADNKDKEPVVEDFDAIMRNDPTQVIVRDEPRTDSMETTEQETESEGEDENETQVVPYADRIAGENGAVYDIETEVYEEGGVRVEYPRLTGLTDEGKQQEINDKIRGAVTGNIAADNLSSYELTYETATAGGGIASFIFRGVAYYVDGAYPNNVVRTLNIDLDSGKNIRLKDFADFASKPSVFRLRTLRLRNLVYYSDDWPFTVTF